MLIAAQSVPQVLPHIMAISQASAAAKELFSVIDRESALDSLSETGATISENDLRGDIVLQNVNLSYPSRPNIPILEDLSINIPAGKVTALVGASGSGKSSIVSLIERWYSHTGGTIALDGRPLETLKLSWLRTVVRLVQQEPTLFSGTIYQNVRDGLTGTRMADLPEVEIRLLVTKACKDAYAHDFIQQLPQVSTHAQISQTVAVKLKRESGLRYVDWGTRWLPLRRPEATHSHREEYNFQP